MCLALNVNSSAHNCGCVVKGSIAMAAIGVIIIIVLIIIVSYLQR